MTLIHNHHWIEGARKFGQWLNEINGMANVKQGGIRSAKVKSRKREPEVKTSGTSVIVDFYAAGSIQRFFCYPADGISLHGLARRIRRALAEKDQRGGVGQSSKEEVAIPEHIRKKLEEERRREEMDKTATLQPSSKEGEILLTERLVQGYEFLLTLAPSADAKEFKVRRVKGLLVQKFGADAGGSIGSGLMKKGLLTSPDSRKGAGREGKQFTVLRKSYKIVPGRKPALVPIQPGAEKPSPRRKKDSVMSCIEAIEGGVRALKDLGFKVVIKSGKVTLSR